MLERYAQLSPPAGVIANSCAVVGGTAALAAVIGQQTPCGWGMGLPFAAVQAAELALDPVTRREPATMPARECALAIAEGDDLDDCAWHRLGLDLRGADKFVVPEVFEHMACNDVVRGPGLDKGGCHAEPAPVWRAVAG